MNVELALKIAKDPNDYPVPSAELAVVTLATEVERLRAATIPKDTRKGEWPEEGQKIWVWGSSWFPWTMKQPWESVDHLWFPEPPPPTTPAKLSDEETT